jgi:hypothetical protein
MTIYACSARPISISSYVIYSYVMSLTYFWYTRT